MSITIGTCPCSWGVWYPDGRPSGIPSNIFAAQAAAAGFKAIELGPPGYLPADPSQLRDVLNQYGFTVCAGTGVYEFAHLAGFESIRTELSDLCRLISHFQTPFLVVMDGTDVGPDGRHKRLWTHDEIKHIHQMIRELGRMTKDQFGIETVFHPHAGTAIETTAEIGAMIEDTGLRLCFDTGHHAYSNGGDQHGDQSALDFIRLYPDRIAYLHFKNVDGRVKRRVREEELSTQAAFDLDVMCDLEDGVIDFVQLKTVLNEIGFSGYGIIEQDLPHATPETAMAHAERNLEFLRRLGFEN